MTMDEYLFNFFSHRVALDERLRIHLCEEHLKLMLYRRLYESMGGEFKVEKKKNDLKKKSFFFGGFMIETIGAVQALLCDGPMIVEKLVITGGRKYRMIQLWISC